MDYRATAQAVLDAVGGEKNVESAAHCATRLRLVIADESKIDEKALDQVEGAKGVYNASGQLQIIFGTGTVNKVYDAFMELCQLKKVDANEVKEVASKKGNIFQRAIRALGDVFVPIIPPIVACGLLMGLLNGLGFAFPAIKETGLFQLVNIFSNAAFVFLQILIGFSAAKVFGGNPYLGAVIGMIMIHTGLTSAYDVPKLIEQGQAIPSANLFGFLNVPLTGYQGHVIPVLIAVWFMSKLETWLHKHVPDILDLFVTPLVSVLLTGLLALSVFGPFFGAVENWVLELVKWFLKIPFGIGGALCGLIYSPTVVLGVHHMYDALEMQMLAGTTPQDFWMPIMTAANMAQAGACLAVALKTKNKKVRDLALPSALSASLGITEPAIFGVNLRFFKPFIAGIIGAACGAAIAAAFGVYSTAMGITGFFGLLDTTNCTLNYILVMVVSSVIAFVISALIYKDPEEEAAN